MLATADGTGLGIFGHGIFLDERPDSIQLLKEHVRIHLNDSIIHVSCKFLVHNFGEAKNILIGFPDRYFNAPIGIGEIRNFTCKVNGQKITEIRKVRLSESKIENPRILFSSSIWIRWEMSIGKNDTALIECEYDSKWGNNNLCRYSFRYTIGPSVTWDGPVIEGRITFDHSDLFSTNVVIRDTINRAQLQREYFDDSVVYSFSNYSPGRKEVVGIKMFQVFWPPIDDSRSNYCPYGGVETIETAQKLRNELYALHGYLFKDSVLSKYYSARKWYKIDRNFDSSKFSAGDTKFLKNLEGFESGLNAKK
jgi:hypothetical protein